MLTGKKSSGLDSELGIMRLFFRHWLGTLLKRVASYFIDDDCSNLVINEVEDCMIFFKNAPLLHVFLLNGDLIGMRR